MATIIERVSQKSEFVLAAGSVFTVHSLGTARQIHASELKYKHKSIIHISSVRLSMKVYGVCETFRD